MRMREFLDEGQMNDIQEAMPMGVIGRAGNWLGSQLSTFAPGFAAKRAGALETGQKANNLYRGLLGWMGTARLNQVSVAQLLSGAVTNMPGGMYNPFARPSPAVTTALKRAAAKLNIKDTQPLNSGQLGRLMSGFVQNLSQTAATSGAAPTVGPTPRPTPTPTPRPTPTPTPPGPGGSGGAGGMNISDVGNPSNFGNLSNVGNPTQIVNVGKQGPGFNQKLQRTIQKARAGDPVAMAKIQQWQLAMSDIQQGKPQGAAEQQKAAAEINKETPGGAAGIGASRTSAPAAGSVAASQPTPELDDAGNIVESADMLHRFRIKKV